MLGDALIIFCLHRNMPKACPYVLIRKFSPRASQFQIIDNQYSIKLWADVKYHVPTGFGFSPKASGFYPFGDATDLVRGRR